MEAVMAYKKLLFRSEARESLLKGTGALADAVRITLGPRSKSVLIQKSFGAPIVCDDGVTMVEESRTTETVLEVVEGLQFDRGYISPYFVTDSEALTAQLEDPAILLHEKKLSWLRPLVPLLESVMQAGRALRPKQS
jgi:chaperonin GroEL (HSP60 family)